MTIISRIICFAAFMACTLPAAVAKTTPALIGYGFAEFQPVCCHACQNVLSSLHLSCSEMDMRLRSRDMMVIEGASDACRLSNKPYMETLAYCIKDQCTEDSISDKEQASCFDDVRPLGEYNLSFEETLPPKPPTTMIPMGGTSLNETSLVNAFIYKLDYLSMRTYARNEYSHSRYSLFIWFFVIGVCCLVGLHRLVRKHTRNIHLGSPSLSAGFRRHLFVPALTGSRHLEPLPYKLGYLPSRILSLFIAIYVALNIVFSFVDYQHVWPALWWSESRIETASSVADRSGVLAIANLALTILFSGRNSLLIVITGWSQNTLLAFHRWAARVTTAHAIVHSTLYSAQWYWSGGAEEYYKTITILCFRWGAVGIVAFCLVLSLAILPIRARFYEFFLITHITLVIVALIGVWYHIQILYEGHFGFQVWLYISLAFWGFDRFARFVRLAILNRCGRSETTFELLPGGKFIQMTIFPKTKWRIAPGQHVFLYMTNLGKVWENHPFTIASHGYTASGNFGVNTKTSDVQEGSKEVAEVVEKSLPQPDHDPEQAIVSSKSSSNLEISHQGSQGPSSDRRFYIRFIIRSGSGMTSSLQQHLLASQPSLANMPTTGKVLIEGPYGSKRQAHRPLETADVVLCIAGGIGITHCLGYLQRYVEDTALPAKQRDPAMRHTRRLVFAWSVRERELLEHVCTNLMPSSGVATADEARLLEYKFWVTGVSHDASQVERDGTVLNTGHRMDVERVVNDVVKGGKRVVVVVCGSGGLADRVRREVAKSAGECESLDLLEEGFAW